MRYSVARECPSTQLSKATILAVAPGNGGFGETTDTRGLYTGRERPVDHDRSLAAQLVSGVFDVLAGWWRSRKVKRRPARFYPGYVHICTSTKQHDARSFGGDQANDARGPAHLLGCATRWRGVKGETFRPIGCGDRCLCPFCAGYYHVTMARGSIEMLTESIKAVEDSGISLATWGQHYTFTLPKDFSIKIDALMASDLVKYRDTVNKLRQAAWRCLKRSIRRACDGAGVPVIGELGAMAVFHHWGRSAPWEPHYHWHFIVAPYTADYVEGGGIHAAQRLLSNWRSVLRWWDQKLLDDMRDDWKRSAQRVLGLKYSETFDVFRSYVKDAKKLGNTMAYQLRPPMQDLWVGIRGNEDIGYRYERNAKGKMPAIDRPITIEQFREAHNRAETVGRKDVVQRVTWYGLLVNFRQLNTLRQLGMAHIDLNDDPDKPQSRAGERYWRPVSADDSGVTFENISGSGEVDIVAWCDLRPDPVPDTCERPIGVTRRRVWLRLGRVRDGPKVKI